MSKRIDQLTAATNDQAANTTWLWLIGDPATGQLYKATISQLQAALGTTTKEPYTATGSEGTTLTIAALSGKTILAILRESGPIFEVDAGPDSEEFTWDSTDIELGRATNPGERFLIIYNG